MTANIVDYICLVKCCPLWLWNFWIHGLWLLYQETGLPGQRKRSVTGHLPPLSMLIDVLEREETHKKIGRNSKCEFWEKLVSGNVIILDYSFLLNRS